MYARIENDVVVEFPIMNIRQRLPQYSFPEVITDGHLPSGFVCVKSATSFPSPTSTQRIEPATTPIKVGNHWELPFVLVNKTQDEIQSDRDNLKRLVVLKVQERLDTFAQTEGFDGILSACTYATSSVPRFAVQGQRCVVLRDQTWAKLYQILDEAAAGQRIEPTSYGQIEAELPSLTW